jgi:hypothetical protein
VVVVMEPTVVQKPIATGVVEKDFEEMMAKADAADYIAYNRELASALAFLLGAAAAATPRDALKFAKFASALIKWRAWRIQPLPAEVPA